MTHGSLFSGIGGFDLAAHWMGWDNTFHCEWNPFGQKVLKHHFPNSISYNDITKTDFTVHEGRIDILTGGFPCQPYSTAGLRKGKADERHLFPEMLRAIKEIKPRWVIGENVRGLVSWNGGLVFHEVCDDLEREGYEVQPFLIPAAGVNAPHQRQRIWFIAYSNNKGRSGEFREIQKENGEISERNNDAESSNSSDGNVANTESIRSSFRKLGESEKRQQIQTRSNIDGFNDLENATNSISIRLEHSEEGRNIYQSTSKTNEWENFPTQSPICGGDDGIPRELDSITFSKWRNESIKAYGNAIVPQVAYEIFKTIEKFENSL